VRGCDPEGLVEGVFPDGSDEPGAGLVADVGVAAEFGISDVVPRAVKARDGAGSAEETDN
jgi:hypothetical protein